MSLTEDSKLRRVPPAVLLAAVTVLCLIPFAGKAFNIDEPLFVWTAQRIQDRPLDFYGFEVNWYGVLEPMHRVMKNPPLASYYAAAVGALFGLGEIALHLAFMIPAAGVVVGTYRLARGRCSRPSLAAILVLISPGFFVSALSVTADVAMLCLWVWAVVLWIEGLERECRVRLFCGALLVAAATLTKYFGLSLIPLLAVSTLVWNRRAWRRLGWLLISIGLLCAYQLWTHQLYGHGLLLDATVYAATHRDLAIGGLGPRGLVALCFTGGCLLPVALGTALSSSRKALVAAGVVGAMLTGGASVLLSDLAPQATGAVTRFLGLEVGLLALCGLAVLALGISELFGRRDPAGFLLAAWILGTFFFAWCVNWAVNARSVLPISVAAAILLVRRLDGLPAQGSSRRLAWALIPAALLTFVLAWSDTAQAEAQRRGAAILTSEYAGRGGVLWFQGHWGFQYYMERGGARALSYAGTVLQPGDLMVLPRNNVNVDVAPLSRVVREVDEIAVPFRPGFVSTMNPRLGAGFYFHGAGPAPFAFGAASPEKFGVVGLTRMQRLEVQRP